MISVLVVEDDFKLNRLFCTVLIRKGYKTLSASNGNIALDILQEEHVDLLITDVMMPEIDGYELVKVLREAGYNMPILMITAKEHYEDKEKGYNIGIDDYMVKPIDVNEMVLRIGALLRRAKIASDHHITLGETILNNDAFTITIQGNELLLPQKEFNLLYKLISYPNKIFTRQQLMDEIWGMETETDERTVDVHINRLRDKTKNSSDFEIVTIRGLGYKVVKSN